MPTTPAKKAPAKKTTAKATAKAPTRGSTPNIPKLPEGWSPAVSFDGPGSARVDVRADDQGTGFLVFFTQGDNSIRRTSASDLAEALKKAGAAITALQRAADQQAKAQKASDDALALLGEEDPGVPPAPKNDVDGDDSKADDGVVVGDLTDVD